MSAFDPNRRRPNVGLGPISSPEPIEQMLQTLLYRPSPSDAPVPIPTARLSEMLRQDYAPEPVVPKYPPLRGFGYRLPIIPPRERLAPSLPEFLGMQKISRPQSAASPNDLSLVVPPPGFEGVDMGPLEPGYRVRPNAPTPRAPSSSIGRIGTAAKRAVGDLFETPLGLSDTSMGGTINRAPDDMRGVGGLIRTFNEVLVQGGSKMLDLAGRAAFAPVVGGIAAVTQAAQEAGMSRADARRLERDLHALVVSVGVAAGTAFGKGPRVPSADRILAEADVRGVLDTAVLDLPRNARAGAKETLRDAFREGKEAGAKAVQERQGSEAPNPAVARPAARIEQTSKSPLTELPAISRTVNPMTIGEFDRLPPTGTVDANRIRTLQGGASEKFKPDPVSGEIYNVLDTTNQLRKEPNFADKLPPIRIFRHGEGIYTLDHRRLVAHRLAGARIRYRLATEEEVTNELPDKLDPGGDNGMSIRVRIGKKREAGK